MSNSTVAPQQTVAVYDPNLNIDAQKYYTVLKGATATSVTEVQSSSQSTSTWTFPYICPDRRSVLNKRFRVGCDFKIQLRKSAGPTNLLAAGQDALRAFPLSSVYEYVKCQLGGTVVDIPLNSVIHPLSRISMDYYNRQMVNNGAPMSLDKSQSYEALAGDQLNPLAEWGSTGREGEDPRGAWNYQVNYNPTGAGAATPRTAVDIIGHVEEPLYLSPFLFANKDSAGLVGLDKIQLTIALSTDKFRMWSGSGKKLDAADTEISVNVILTNPVLYVTSYTLPSDLERHIPEQYPNKYNEIEYIPFNPRKEFTDYSLADDPQPAGSTMSIVTDAIQLKGIPNKAIFFVRKPYAISSYNDTDTFCRIDGVTIKYANQAGILSTATTFDLYQMSRRNGLQYSFADWRGEFTDLAGTSSKCYNGIGSVLCLEFGTDIPLRDESAGVDGVKQFQISLNVTNLKNNVEAGENSNNAGNDFVPYAPELGMIFIYEGMLTIDTKNCKAMPEIGVVSQADYDRSKPVSAVDYYDVKDVVGGNFLSSFKNVFDRYLKPAIGYVHTASDVAKKVGLGHSGGGHSGGGSSGGQLEIAGGRAMKKRALEDRLK